MKQVKQYEYVDLGLPSGLKWAKCNVGAEKETDYGDYFMWGSTTPNTADECTWANTPFNGGASSYDEAYFNSVKDTVCPNGVLAKEYDTASQIMGGDWRMPTKAEIQELIDYTTNKWFTNYNGTGVSGTKFTGSNGNSIFIRAVGSCFYGSVYGVGGSGGVWSSSLYTSNSGIAWRLGFSSDYCDVGDYGLCGGQSVRGVKE